MGMISAGLFPPLEVLLLPENTGVDGNGAELEADRGGGGGEESTASRVCTRVRTTS